MFYLTVGSSSQLSYFIFMLVFEKHVNKNDISDMVNNSVYKGPSGFRHKLFSVNFNIECQELCLQVSYNSPIAILHLKIL